jgi:hypothetical protein
VAQAGSHEHPYYSVQVIVATCAGNTCMFALRPKLASTRKDSELVREMGVQLHQATLMPWDGLHFFSSTLFEVSTEHCFY